MDASTVHRYMQDSTTFFFFFIDVLIITFNCLLFIGYIQNVAVKVLTFMKEKVKRFKKFTTIILYSLTKDYKAIMKTIIILAIYYITLYR